MIDSNNWSQNNSYGVAAEEDIAEWLDTLKIHCARHIKSMSDTSIGGPEIKLKNKIHDAPDMHICRYGKIYYLEVKHTPKCVGYFSNAGVVWRLSIKYSQYEKYCKMSEGLASAVKLIIVWSVDGGFNTFVGQPSPSGKFCQDIKVLMNLESKIVEPKENQDKLISWSITDLKRFADWIINDTGKKDKGYK